MEELNAERIIEIHDDIIREYGGTGGLLTQGTLELLIYKVNREKDVYKHTVKTIESWIREKARTTSAPIF